MVAALARALEHWRNVLGERDVRAGRGLRGNLGVLCGQRADSHEARQEAGQPLMTRGRDPHCRNPPVTSAGKVPCSRGTERLVNRNGRHGRTVAPPSAGTRRARAPSRSPRENAARAGPVDHPLRIFLEQKPLPDEVAGCGLDGAHKSLVVPVPLFERQSRIATRQSFGFRPREWEERATQTYRSRLRGPAIRFQPVLVPTGTATSTVRTPPASRPSLSGLGTNTR